MITAIIFLRFTIGILMIVFGLRQLKKPLEWNNYIPDFAHPIIHSEEKEARIMRIHATGNVMLGLFLVSGIAPLLAAWFALLWWIAVAPFGFIKRFQIGLRDTSIISAIAALILLLI